MESQMKAQNIIYLMKEEDEEVENFYDEKNEYNQFNRR